MIATLKDLLGEKVSFDPSVLEAHGKDTSYPEIHPPAAVVFAVSVEDVLKVLAWCQKHHTPVIPFGAGSSLEGHITPQSPAISLDFSLMNNILEVYPQDFLVAVEPGVRREELNQALRDTGLFFPVDPGANATLGGMAATNASGTTTVKYGGMHQNVAELEVVLANGDILHLGRSVRKTSSGYDLKDLFIGSGGTLELLDELSIKVINRDLKRTYLEKPALFLEFHSSTGTAIEEESAIANKLVRAAGALDINVAKHEQERADQWEARHHFYWAFVHCNPGCLYYTTDTAVPISRVTELVTYAQQLLTEMRLEGSIVGHVGDGNFHTLIATLPEEYSLAEIFSELLVNRSLELGGTATGEHGIGLVKRKFMEAEHGAALDWMRQIKALFDPEGLLNPGKIV